MPRVVVSGASGLVGTRLGDLLRDAGRNVCGLNMT
jgi:nucleoside-diphosphate-sugar epimerase